MHKVTAFYDVGSDGPAAKDEIAIEAAGKQPLGTGTFLPTMTRDLCFTFDTESEAAAAQERLKDCGFRFIQ